MPATIVNRSGERTRVTVRAKLGAVECEAIDIQLTGATEQAVELPVKFPKAAKQIPLHITLTRGDEKLFVEQRKMTIPPPLTLAPIIPTHWAVEDGPPTLSGEVDLAVSQKMLDGAALKATLVDASGKVCATWTSDNAHAPKDFTNAFTLSSEPLPVGAYRVIIALKSAEGDEGLAEQPFGVIERRQARVTLNDSGYPVHDGTAIFPLGIFNGGARVKEMGEAGFTVQHAYNAVNVEPGERPNDQGAKDFLDNASDNGMKGLFLIPRGLAFSGDWEGVRRRIRMFKNHPALLAWDEEEGIARGDLAPEGLAKLVSLIREEDPHHPIMVGDARDIISRMTDRSNFFPTDHMDLGMWWWYPFPLDKGKDSGLEGEERSKELELAPPSFLALAKVKQPLWVGVQSYKKPPEWGRYPTPLEYRAQAYLAIIHGAKGLMWYGGSVTGGMYAKLEEAHWPELKAIVRELRDLSPTFMGETMESPPFEPGDAKLSVMLKRSPEGRLILLAVNRAAKPVDVTIKLRDIEDADIAVLSEKRSVSIMSSGLRDHFDPYAVHVYEVKR
ncbi:MAG: hypothetical protein H0T11_07115 [Chthoniobacterales bacterium]|nr:hypothetical protein [Chthoniobacterales bacterium]